MKTFALASLSALIFCGSAQAADINVAVAANFTAPMKDIAAVYEKETGNKVLASFGGTGQFFAQIKNGAPVKGSARPYAYGKLVLWSATPDFVKESKDFLLEPAVKKIAVANPKLAPYGEAAYQTLEKWGMLDKVKNKFVTGDNIGKTYQFAKTSNAEVGFVALSQVYKGGKMTSGSGWVMPSDLYSPIRQDVVVLNLGKDNKDVAAFMKFMETSPKVRDIILSYGYGLE